MNDSNITQQYDNHFSGALFPTEQEGILTGPMQLDGDEPEHVVVMKLGEPGSPHAVKVYDRGDNGNPKGRALAQGEVQRTETGGALTSTGNATPVARGHIKFKGEEIPVCIWKAQRRGNGPRFYQLKPDELVTRELPEL